MLLHLARSVLSANIGERSQRITRISLGSAKFSYATAFLAETTIWMDILGSVSLQRAPKLHKYYIKFLGNDENADNPYGLFLSRVMGCENRVCHLFSSAHILYADTL